MKPRVQLLPFSVSLSLSFLSLRLSLFLSHPLSLVSYVYLSLYEPLHMTLRQRSPTCDPIPAAPASPGDPTLQSEPATPRRPSSPSTSSDDELTGMVSSHDHVPGPACCACRGPPEFPRCLPLCVLKALYTKSVLKVNSTHFTQIDRNLALTTSATPHDSVGPGFGFALSTSVPINIAVARKAPPAVEADDMVLFPCICPHPLLSF